MNDFGTQAVVDFMRANGVPITRENWLDFNYGVDQPDTLSAEDMALLPDELSNIDVADFDPSEPRDPAGKWTATAAEIKQATEVEKRLGISRAPIVEGYDKHAAVRLFHGTASDFYDSIKQNGLKAGHPGGSDDYLRRHVPGAAPIEAHRAPSCFVTSSGTAAEAFAELVAHDHPGSKPVVFKVNVPVAELSSFKVDEQSNSVMKAVRLERDIPKEWIGGRVLMKPVDYNHSLIQGDAEPDTVTLYVVALVDGET